ncbi:hypothetical protein [Taylorella equigenitalis]|uniref:hypothetical protein n=1 Tax=Taylorella equigenitalis TaxID=29575 RepID=UPI0004250DCD|nr:hypothetical protein [Taylorella equigenitalis]ASY42540.1 hypothetical protein CA943_05425 [Taylorella equigenitalis]WDU45966.1 hypothetical protein KNO33_05485 [Taylorella equigenitalis]
MQENFSLTDGEKRERRMKQNKEYKLKKQKAREYSLEEDMDLEIEIPLSYEEVKAIGLDDPDYDTYSDLEEKE